MTWLQTALANHPFTCAILLLYSGNVTWYGLRKEWGLSIYWFAAGLITVSATWLRDWRG